MHRNTRAVGVALATVVAICFIGLVEPAVAQGQRTEPDGQSGSMLTVITTAVWRVGSVVAAAFGVFLAWRNRNIFRAKAPHITISHEISHRLISTQYVHIFVTAILHNTSRVHIEFLDGYAGIQQVKPMSDADAERLYRQVFVEQGYDSIQWDTLDFVQHRWDKDELLVEPGEIETETFDFMVHRDVESVRIETYFYNSRAVGKLPGYIDSEVRPTRLIKWFKFWRKRGGPLGWGRTTVHDIIEPK